MLRASKTGLVLRSQSRLSTNDSGGNDDESLNGILPNRLSILACIVGSITIIYGFHAEHANRGRRYSSRFYPRRSESQADHSPGSAQSKSGGACLLSRILVTVLCPAVGRTQDPLEEE